MTVAIYLHLTEAGKAEADARKGIRNLLRDFCSSFKNAKGLRRFIFIECVGAFSMDIVFPFALVFAVEVKMADPFILGYIGVGATLSNMS